jgi:hypothetical protein
MRLIVMLAAVALVTACGDSDNEQLQDAANQSDPAAAQVLNDAANAGVPPQEALEHAGQAAATTNTDIGPASAQARPNQANEPNPPQPGESVEKTTNNGTAPH